MNLKIEKLPAHRIKCTVEIPAEHKIKAEQQALKKLSASVRIDGFRPGKAPVDKVKERVSADELLKETVRGLLPALIKDAMTQSKAQPILPPKVEIASDSPLKLHIIFIERPAVTVKAGSIAVAKSADPTVTDKELDDVVVKLQKTDLAKGKTPEQLKADVKPMLLAQKTDDLAEKREEEFFKQVRQNTEVDIAPELKEEEVKQMVADMQRRLKQQNVTVEQWLKSMGKTTEEVMNEMQSIADDRITLRFGLHELAKVKKVEVTEVEVKQAAEAFAKIKSQQHGHAHSTDEWKPGTEAYDQLYWNLTVEKVKKMYL